jgi:hypothetical protein
MSSLAELPELAGFFSYSREDDEAFKGMLSALRDGIQRELSAQLGRSKRTFHLWQDQVAIAPGKLWESEIKAAVDESFFFLPIVTPRSVSSKYCKFEFESFLAREKATGRSDLIFPILYISVAALENEAKWRDDPVLSTIGRRQYVDWRPLRHLDVQSTAVREQIERLCQKIVEALNAPWTSPEERQRMEEANTRQQAEEEARRLEAQAKLRAEEEQHRKQAEAEARWRAAEERKRQKAEAKRLADEEEDRKRAEAESRPVADKRQEAEAKLRTEQHQAFAAIERHKGWPISSAFVKDWQNKHSARVVAGAAVLAALLLIGGGYAFLRHTVEKGTQQAELKWEEQRKAVETETNSKVADADQQRLAAEAEAKLKADAEQRRLADLKAEQERQARAQVGFESAGFVWLSDEQQEWVLKAIKEVGIGLDQIPEAEEIGKFPTHWPQIGRAGDLIFVADKGWLSRFPHVRAPRFSQAMSAFMKESRPNIRAFTLSAEGIKLLQSFSAYQLSFPGYPPSTIRWSKYIKTANLPL